MNPTQSEKLLELAAKCEAADGPDRDIDRALCPLVGIQVVDEGHPLGRCYYDENGHGVPLPLFTASLDAAMTLVSEGLFPTIDFVTKRVWIRDAKGFDVGFEPAHGFAANVPLSICAAALRARATQTNGE